MLIQLDLHRFGMNPRWRAFCRANASQLAMIAAAAALLASSAVAQQPIPRGADGKPNLQGIWQASGTAAADLQDHVASLNMLAGRSVISGGAAGGAIPYQPWAAKKRAENFASRQTADPLSKCYIPGVPRVMYLDFPFQIFQSPSIVTMAFEWELDYRLIYTNGTPHPSADDDFWMGDSRGRWEGDTLVVDVRNINDKTWLDMAGDFHSEALHVVERYRMTDRDTIQYEATLDDAKVFSKPWTINLALHRRADRDRLFEYVCEAEVEEADGDFTREERTWYPGSPAAPPVKMDASTYVAPPVAPVPNLRRTPAGKPDLQGFFQASAGGANYGLEKHGGDGLVPGGRGVIVDPPDGKLPMQPWAVAERKDRNRDERGYDDSTAHCFPAGAPRSMYVPAGIEIIQTPDYVVFLHERVAWRIVALNRTRHLPESMRLWQGDSIGHWEGDTLVIDTTNFNGKTWLNEVGEIATYAEHTIERITPTGPDAFTYQATVIDPVAYTRPWTIAFPIRREKFELLEAACHEEDHDLPHLKIMKYGKK
jgi:hypothetical protein